jgi:DNA invertase Pin-like site-specific DNA recombinase
VFAEFEINFRKERQTEGIARAKANRVYAGKGRPASIDAVRELEMKAQGLGASSNRQSARHRPGDRLSSIGSGVVAGALAAASL